MLNLLEEQEGIFLISCLLQPLDIYEWIHDDIFMKFMKELLTLDGFNMILVTISYLNKYTHFSMFKHLFSTQDVA